MRSISEKFTRAIRQRDALRAGTAAGATDLLRLLDGAGDDAEFDGLFIDDFAGRWLVQTSRPGQTPPEWLREVLPAPVSIYWKRLDSRDQRAPEHWAGQTVNGPFVVQENGLKFQIDFQAGYSQGIFLDQRDNRRTLRERLAPGTAILNAFAYTCAFSVAAAAAGARTVSVDLSRRSLDWGQTNFALNGLDAQDPGMHEFLAGDVFDWLRRLGKRERRFDAIVLDPPTFSRSRDGKVFRVEDDFGALVRLAAPLLSPGGHLLCSANARGFPAAGFQRAVLSGLPAGAVKNGWTIEPRAMPPDFTGTHYLQCAWVRRPV